MKPVPQANLRKFFSTLSVLLVFLIGSPAAYGLTTWSGAVSTDWATAGNWSPAMVPDASADATVPTLPSSGRFPVISSGSLAVNNFTIQTGAVVTQTGGSLTVHDFIINSGGTYLQQGGDVDVNHDFTIKSGGTYVQQDGYLNLAHDFTLKSGATYLQQGGYLKLDHDWSNSGTFAATGGTVEFASGAKGNFTATNQFYNLIIDAGVDPSLFDKTGTGANSVGIAGDFINNRTIVSPGNNSTIVFNGTGDQTIYSASVNSTFGNLVVNKPSGTLSLTSSIMVVGDVAINDGTVDLGTNLLNRQTYGGNFALNGDSVLAVGGAFPSNFANVNLGPGATVQYTDNIRLAIAPVNGSCRVSGTGTPGRTYRLQWASGLSGGTWQDVSGGTLTADAAGHFECLATPSAAVCFYRCAYP